MKSPLHLLKLTLFIAILFQSTQIFAQGWRPNEMEIRVELSDRTDAKTLGGMHLIGDIYYKYALMYVIPDELKLIREAGLDFQITKENLNEYSANFWETRDAYHSYEETVALMDSLAEALPGLVMKKTYGQSIQGRELSAIKISDNVTVDENEAEMAFDGSIHGDEIGGCENSIRFARWLCQKYGEDPEITDLIDNREIWIYPLVNPDGREALARYNSAGVDLNRDWGYLWGGDGNSPGPYSQPESKAMRQMDYENQFTTRMTLHSGTELFLYPWYNRTEPCPDNSEVMELADVYVNNSGYSNLQSGPGTSLYPTTGTTAESYYGVMGSHGIVMELSSDKQPPTSQLMYYFNINLPSMVKMVEYAGYGVEGIISDSETGDPVAAVIYVGPTLPCYSDPEVGDFHKFMMPGNYDIKIKANGYQTKVVNNIQVNELSSTVIDIELEPEEHQSIYRICATEIPGGNMADEGASWNAIGPPDNLNYSLGKDGWMVFDMQQLVLDGEGNDIIVFEGDATDEGFTFYAGSTMDGPWVLLGDGSGTTEFDLGESTLNEARFFKMEDDGDGSGNVADAGFDLDAVQSMSSIAGAYILIDEIVINDNTGNGNGQLDPGETADFEITLKNIGNEDALNVTGTLTCPGEYITVQTSGPQEFGDILMDETALATYTVSADELVPAGHTSTFALAYTGDNGISGTKYFEITFPDYCCPTANCSFSDGFAGFSLGQIDNMNNGCSPNGYGDFTDMSTELAVGETYTVEWETGYDNQLACLWIDLDSDMAFEQEELLIADFNLINSGQVYSTNFTLPENLVAGEKRMRIRANWQESATDPCLTFSYGETEDYTVVISSGSYMMPSFIAGETEVCEGGEVQFTDNSVGDITAWSWGFPGANPATSTEQNPMVIYENPGVYDVTLTVSNDLNSQSVTYENYITTFALPEVTFTEIDDMCLNWPEQELTQGYPDGGEYSGPGVMYGYFYPEEAGIGSHTLSYTYIDGNGCENFAEQTVYVDECVGIDETHNGFSVQPNPGNGTFYLSVENDMSAHKISILNILGKEVFVEENIQLMAGTTYHIRLANQQPGIYLLKISSDKESILKIIIQ